jgi:hypothetical protein
LDVIENRCIRFSQVASFNDPIESSAFVGPLPDSRPLQDVIDDTFREGEFGPNAEPDDAMRAFSFSFANVLGVLSLSEDPVSLLMWAHYGERHEGLVLGLTTDHEFFRPQGIEAMLDDDKGLNRLRPIVYQTDRPTAIDQMALAFSDDAPFMKSPEWSYEREWRIRKHKEDAIRTLSAGSTFPVWLFQLPPDCIVEVVLGCRMRPSIRTVLAKLLAHKDYQQVRLYQAWPHPIEYRLQLIPISLETIALPQTKLVIRNVPEGQIRTVIGQVLDLPALKVERVRQPDFGLWTLVAIAIVSQRLDARGKEMDWTGVVFMLDISPYFR